MNDQSSEVKNYNELKFAREQGFFEKNKTIRFIIGLFLILVLFFFVHFRNVRVEELDLYSTAPHFIVTQTDVDFLDEEAMSVAKYEAARSIGKIYQISPNEMQQHWTEFETTLLQNEGWRNHWKECSLEEFYRGFIALEKILIKTRFTDSRTLEKIKELKLPPHHFFINEEEYLHEPIVLSGQTWNQITQIALLEKLASAASLNCIIQYIKMDKWDLEEDNKTQDFLQKKAQSSLPDKYTHIAAGIRIINQGDRVTARHVSIMEAIKKKLKKEQKLWSFSTIAGSFFLTLLLTGITIAYFQGNHPKTLHSNRKLFLLTTIVSLVLILAKATEFFLLSSNHMIDIIRYPIFVPLASILVCSLINSSIATFISGFLTIVLALTMTFESESFIVMNLSTALVAISCAKLMRRRKEIFGICAKAWLCSIAVIISFIFYNQTAWDSGILIDCLTTATFLLLTAVTAVGLLPLLESRFHIMTDVALIEYMDLNNDLLRRLTIEASGTYQHSVVVGNIAETAALAIGANGLFCRVSTLYHDIGKMIAPQYFTENQLAGTNIHQLLTPQESAEVIISHVSEGVAMARKAGLPEQFIDIIKEHHGTTAVYYFYRQQLDRMGGNKDLVDERDFRYAGPKPRSKESTIIMIADSLEAASRSLEKINEENITELTERLVREKMEDGQFTQSLLTLEELTIVKASLIKSLVAFCHSRVKYPLREI